MCGIAGFVQRDPDLPLDLVTKQLELLEHRGPDSSGFHAGRRAVVGQTRLSIIDLVTGDPPIANEDGSVGVALNGEIYNFESIREVLRQKGHVFRTQGDTEVIAHLAEDLSPVELASALDGMFAFAVWDDKLEELTLGRDRAGKKPLYYWYDEQVFVFASELKALLAHPSVPRRLSDEAIPAYLVFGYVPTPGTFFENVRSVPPGHVLTVRPGEAPALRKYWEVQPTTERFGGSLDDAAHGVRSLLREAVRRRLVSDVPLGAFLSGGIDSSAIVGLMTELSSDPVRTFTIGFEDTEGYDERVFASQVAKRFRTDHHELVVHPNAVDLIERLVYFHDQPFGDSSAIPTFLLSEMTRSHVKVALCGDGGDELFAGYPRFAAGAALAGYRRVPSAIRRATSWGARKAQVGSLRRHSEKLQRYAERAEAGLPDAYLSLISHVPHDEVAGFVPKTSHWAVEDFGSIWRLSEGADTVNRLLHLNFRTYLLDDLLVKVDRMSMAHGLEVRAPFLDRELTEFAFSLPGSFKVKRFTLKRVLKRAVSDLLPREILHRPKRGFGVPLERWFRTDLSTYVDSMIVGNRSHLSRHVDSMKVDALIAEHRSGNRNHANTLWALLALEVFLRREDW